MKNARGAIRGRFLFRGGLVVVAALTLATAMARAAMARSAVTTGVTTAVAAAIAAAGQPFEFAAGHLHHPPVHSILARQTVVCDKVVIVMF